MNGRITQGRFNRLSRNDTKTESLSIFLALFLFLFVLNVHNTQMYRNKAHPMRVCECVCVNVLTYIRIITHLSIRDLDTVRLTYTEFVQIT